MNRVERLIQEAKDALKAMEEIVSGHRIEDFLQSTTARFALRYAVIQFWEALSEIIYILVESHAGKPPSGFRESVETAFSRGIISIESKEVLRDLGKLRNIVVHRYWEVDDERLYRETRNTMVKARKLLEELERNAKTS